MPIYKIGANRYQVRINYTDRFGNHKQVCRCNDRTTTKKGATEVEMEMLEQINLEQIDSVSMTFGTLYDRYMEDRASELKASTKRHYTSAIPLYVLPYFGKTRINEIRPSDIQAWKRKVEKHGLQTETKKDIYKMFSAIMNYAVKMYGLPSNPLKIAGNFKDPFNGEDELHYWTYEQFNVFRERAREELVVAHPDDLLQSGIYTMYNILYFAGLRKGEANALNWNDIITSNGRHLFRITKSINLKTKPYEITGPKNKTSIRSVPICDELWEAIQEHRKLCQRSVGFSNAWFICGGPRPVQDTSICVYKDKIAEECGLPPIRVHDFRHSFCSLLINGGVPLFVIARTMGHSNTNVTQMVYSHIYPETSEQALDYLNSLKKR